MSCTPRIKNTLLQIWCRLLYSVRHKGTIWYRLLDCLKRKQFVTKYCIVTNTDSLLQAAVLSGTQTVTQFNIQLLFTSVIQGQQ
jgi:hypothetical protein